MSDSIKETDNDVIEVYENGDEDSLEEPATSDTASEEPHFQYFYYQYNYTKYLSTTRNKTCF